jgi:DNA-binding SARP family transcriptional activator
MLQRHRILARDTVAGQLWGEYPEQRARSCLSTALWRLRRVLEPPDIAQGTYILNKGISEIGFNEASDYWLDVDIFEEKITRMLNQPLSAISRTDVHMADEALHLYTGDLLEGFHDEWVLYERERLRFLYLSGLERLMVLYLELRDFDKSLVLGHQLLQHNGLREDVHCMMMRLYLQQGQRGLAIQQYERCCKVLADELGIVPMEETTALYARILSGDGVPHPAPSQAAAHLQIQQILNQLHEAQRTYEEAQRQFQRAIELAEHLFTAQS